MPGGAEVLELADVAAFEAWLAEHHDDQTEAWLRIGRKHAPVGLISISDALDVALCFGWIDGQRRSLDDVSFRQRYSPRRARSSWSQVNVEKVEALTAAGRMRPSGLAEVALAKADGRWDAAYERQSTAEPPADLLAALAADEPARTAYDALGRTERYLVILALAKARTPEGRARTLAREISRLRVGAQRS